nr:6-bladed beta-propeller [Candidatus Thorarchaeota archaeon]NIW13436.1 6-bladed beta-propeller [Candidatus Thorarchaeota archaeon]NIW51546.1 6-bladed beta-propeller [Candidatus Korarchaeota archaeon]
DSWGEDLIADVHGVFISDSDEIFVVARGVHEVLKFNSSGELLLRIGSRGLPSWQKPFNHPTDVAVSDRGDIFVTDGYGNAAVHKFLESGKHVFSWGEPGSGKGEFHTPHGIWVHKGKVYVVDRDNNRVQIFNEEGEYITEWCDFFHPMGIYVDSKENIFVTDQTPRFTVLNLHGKILSRGFSPDFGHGVWGDSSGNLYMSSNEKGVNRFIKI